MDDTKPTNPFVDPFDPDNLRADANSACRQTAQRRLLDEVRFMRNKADRLEKLAAAVAHLPVGSSEEVLLWELICDAFRR